MRVFVWQSFCSNNSGAYHLVARFSSPRLASEVARELQAFFEVVAEDPGSTEALDELASRHNFEWLGDGERMSWLDEWADACRVDVDGDRVLVYNSYCLGLEGLVPYLHARGSNAISAGAGEPKLAALFQLERGAAVKEALAELRQIFETQRDSYGESFWWHHEELGGFYGGFRHEQIAAIKALLQRGAFASYRLLLGDSDIRHKLRIMADCPSCPQCGGALSLLEAGGAVSEDQALCHDCGGMYELASLARMSPIARLESDAIVAVVADADAAAVALAVNGAVWRWSSQSCWKRLCPPQQGQWFRFLLRRRSGALLRCSYQGIDVSEDGGQSWAELSSHSGYYPFILAESPDRVLFGARGSKLYRSADGRHWQGMRVRGNTPFTAMAAASDTTRIYAARSNGQILCSTDRGGSWNTQWPAKNHCIHRVVALSESPAPDGQAAVHAVAVGEKGLVLTSVDGETWSETRVGTTDIRDVTWCADGDRLLAVNDDGELLISIDRGLSWRAKKIGPSDPLRSLCRCAGGELIAVGDYGAAVTISSQALNGVDDPEQGQ